MKIFKAPLAVVAAAALLLLSGCAGTAKSSTTATPKALTTVRLAFTPGTGTLDVHLAETLGYFKANGLDVQTTEGLDLPLWAAALGRQYDVAMTTAGIFISGADKFDMVGVSGGQLNAANIENNALIVRNPAIKSIGDLSGKRVGLATITGTTPASLKYLINEAGGDASTTTLVALPFAAQADQLKAGQVDAVVSASPFLQPVVEDKTNRVLVKDVQYAALHAISPNESTTVNVFFVGTKTWVKANPAAAKAFRTSLQQAIDYIKTHDKSAKAELASWLKISPSIIDKAPGAAYSSTVSAGQIQPIVDLYIKNGTVAKNAVPDLKARITAFQK